MSEPENFLSRWTRLKREAAEPPTNTPEAAPPPADPNAGAAYEQADATSDMPDIDLSALPDIELITSATDIRAFLAPGVPVELTRAALRRAWVADPAIRDFIEIAENQWDFTAPDSIPGFGPLGPLDDVAKLVARIVGDAAPPPQSTPDAPEKHEQLQREEENKSEIEPASSTIVEDQSHAVQSIAKAADVATEGRPESTALQHNELKQNQPDTSNRRRHGGALPH